MIPTVTNVNDLLREHLGDTMVTGGQLFAVGSSAFLKALDAAYQELFSRLSVASSDRLERTSYCLLPAYTSYLKPSTKGMANFGIPEQVYSRGNVISHVISNAVVNASIPSVTLTLSTSLPSWFVSGMSGDVMGVAGISDDINDSFSVTVTNSTTVELNGCSATGTFSGSNGRFVVSQEDWSDELVAVDDDEDFPVTAGSSVDRYMYKKGVFRFPNCSNIVELQFVYSLSGSAPTGASDSLGIDDSLNFLAARTGQICAQGKGNMDKMKSLMALADYHLGLMLSGSARDMQNGDPIYPPFWRTKRNIRQGIW